MRSNCKKCNCELNEETAAKAYSKSGTYRAICKKCRSRSVVEYQSKNKEHRRIYANSYARRIGKVKEYPCETCGKSCYKKYRRALCSDLCRLMAFVDKTDNCWLWKGSVTRGYGKTNLGSDMISAHRLAYTVFKGPIAEGMFICHSCDNKLCVNPAHLWEGTHQENMLDMTAKDRQASKLTAEDVYKIRKLVEKEGYPQQKIVEQFKITCGTVSSIINRRLWKHI